jgi:hypothetical protein
MSDDFGAFLELRAHELHRIALALVGEEGGDSVADVPPAEDEVTVDEGEAEDDG